MSEPICSLDTLYAWEDISFSRPRTSSKTPTAPLRMVSLISNPDRIRALPQETPIFGSVAEAFSHLLQTYPSPDANLTYFNTPVDPSNPEEAATLSIFDTPIYCGPPGDTELLRALTFRYPSIWIRPSSLSNCTLPFPLRLTTIQSTDGHFRLLTNNPSLIKRVRTLSTNRETATALLLSGGPLPLAPLLLSHSHLSSILPRPSLHLQKPLSTRRRRRRPPLHQQDSSSSKPILIDGRITFLQNLYSHLSNIPDPSLHVSYPAHWRRFLRTTRTRSLLLSLIPLIPYLPLFHDPSPLKDTPYFALYSSLAEVVYPYWNPEWRHGTQIHSPLINSPSPSHLRHWETSDHIQRATTTQGSHLAALIAREIRIGLRLHRLTLSSARALLPFAPRL